MIVISSGYLKSDLFFFNKIMTLLKPKSEIQSENVFGFVLRVL